MGAWQRLAEYYTFGARPDLTVGAAGGRRPATLVARGEPFPYDSDEIRTGTNQRYDRTSAHTDAPVSGPPTPRDLRHTAWDPDGDDPEVEEALGYPGLFGRANQGDGAGRTLPGTDGGWASAPFDDLDLPDADEASDLVAVVLGQPSGEADDADCGGGMDRGTDPTLMSLILPGDEDQEDWDEDQDL